MGRSHCKINYVLGIASPFLVFASECLYIVHNYILYNCDLIFLSPLKSRHVLQKTYSSFMLFLLCLSVRCHYPCLTLGISAEDW